MGEEVAIVGIILCAFCSLSTAQLSSLEWESTAQLDVRWVGSELRKIIDSSTSQIMINFLATWTVQQNGVISCGLYCKEDGCVFSVFVYSPRPEMSIPEWQYAPRVVWSANRNTMVEANASVEFRADGNLVLQKADGSIVWATHTYNRGVVQMGLDSSGNLLLLDSRKEIVWQSFDYPTSVLLPGQIFKRGLQLIAAKHNEHHEGSYGMEILHDQLVLYAIGSPPQLYWKEEIGGKYLLYGNFSLESIGDDGLINKHLFSTQTLSFHYLQIESDGNIKVHALLKSTWTVIYDLYQSFLDSCLVPDMCGRYGVCKENKCACPQIPSSVGGFVLIDNSKPKLGCTELSNVSSSNQQMIQLRSIDYFAWNLSEASSSSSSSSSATETGCEERCLHDPSCKISVHVIASGKCYLFDRVFTLRASSNRSDVSLSIKIQTVEHLVQSSIESIPQLKSHLLKTQNKYKSRTWVVAVFSGLSAPIFILVSLAIYWILSRNGLVTGLRRQSSPPPSFPGLPKQFSYRKLQVYTRNFSQVIGQGGFGTVFLGKLPSGKSVAVKRLESANKQGQKQFEAEVCTIGSIHHVNLVKLQGFCAEGEHRLLVYDYMSNGSLADWIFVDGDKKKLMDWNTRFSVTLGTAKGLAYLHDECENRIIHLDIKPQNILLDEHMVARVSDFGLSKLMGKDESEIMTHMQGTPGYLAPEWLHCRISEKADVYSFGIVVLEIVCGRRCIDYECEDPNKGYLPAWVNLVHVRKGIRVVDVRLKEEELDCEQAKRVVDVGLWCIQDDPNMRPSMACVVDMLKGILDVPNPPLVHSNKLSSAFCHFVKSLSESN